MREFTIVLLAYAVGLTMGLLGHFFEPGRIVYLAPGATEISCSMPAGAYSPVRVVLPPIPSIDIVDDFNQVMKGDKQ